eukprot:2713969-Pyramimonas_sp.AAC.1
METPETDSELLSKACPSGNAVENLGSRASWLEAADKFTQFDNRVEALETKALQLEHALTRVIEALAASGIQ